MRSEQKKGYRDLENEMEDGPPLTIHSHSQLELDIESIQEFNDSSDHQKVV